MKGAPGRAAASGPSAEEVALPAAVQEDLYRLEVYKEQLTALVRQQELLRVSLEAHGRAQATLEEADTMGSEREILIPIGAETFLRALPRTQEKVLIGLGSGLVAELERPKALEILGQRRVELEKAEQGTLQQLRRLESEAAQVQARLQEAYQSEQQASLARSSPRPAAVHSRAPRPTPSD